VRDKAKTFLLSAIEKTLSRAGLSWVACTLGTGVAGSYCGGSKRKLESCDSYNWPFFVTPIHDRQAKRRTIVLTSAGGLFPHRLCQLYRVDLGGETEHLKHPNPVPVDINFVPLQAVTRRRWVGMMVVVPPFAECQ
jgi:hypothetical protein